MKVTVIQQLLPKYRIDVFHALQALLEKRKDHLKLLSVENPFYKMSFEHAVFKARKKYIFWIAENLKPLLRDSKVIIVLWDIHWVSLMLLPFTKKKGQKVILWGHGISNSDNFLAKIPRKITAYFADALIFYDPIRKNEFSEKNIRLLRKSFVAPNTVIVSNHGESAAEEKKSFLYVGRINKHKQIDQLIQAYLLYSKQRTQPKPLIIVGGGELLEEMREEVEKNNLNHLVKFTGPIYEDELLRPYFFSALCYVNPGTVGLGIVHAFAFGTPVIVCRDRRHGPEFSYCNESNSIVYSGDESALAEKLLLADENPQRMNEMGKHAYRYFIKELQVSNMLAGITDAIDFVASNNRRIKQSA